MSCGGGGFCTASGISLLGVVAASMSCGVFSKGSASGISLLGAVAASMSCGGGGFCK